MSHFRSYGIEKFLNPLSVCSIFDRFYWKLKGDFKRMKKSYCAIFASFSNWTHIYLNVHLPLDGFCEIFCQFIFHSTTRTICLGLLSQKSYEPSVLLIMLIRGYSKSIPRIKYLNIPLKKVRRKSHSREAGLFHTSSTFFFHESIWQRKRNCLPVLLIFMAFSYFIAMNKC